MSELLLFDPIYQERVWGGRALETSFRRVLPSGAMIGESWEMVDRPEAQSLSRAFVRGCTTLPLRELIRRDPAGIMGTGWNPERRFPILVKWLDCRDRLSLQVHPPERVAAELGGEPKTENWYFVQTSSDAMVFAGLKKGVSRDDFERAIGTGAVEDCLHQFRVAAGDSFFVPSGRLHAIGGGQLILEIQQNSDTTYRLHDWGRTGPDGNARKLHIQQGLRSVDWLDFEPEPYRASRSNAILASCPSFSIRRVPLSNGETLGIQPGEPRILSVVKGIIDVGSQTLITGDNALSPSSASAELRARTDAMLLITEGFNR